MKRYMLPIAALAVTIALFAAATGREIFRGDYFIEFSIYSAYTIAILVYLARPQLTVYDRGAAWLFSLLCGSTMGLLLLILAEVVGRRVRLRTAVAATVFAPIALVVLNFLMVARVFAYPPYPRRICPIPEQIVRIANCASTARRFKCTLRLRVTCWEKTRYTARAGSGRRLNGQTASDMPP